MTNPTEFITFLITPFCLLHSLEEKAKSHRFTVFFFPFVFYHSGGHVHLDLYL